MMLFSRSLLSFCMFSPLSFGFFHKTPWKSLSSSSSWTCRYILVMSADSATWWNRNRIRTRSRYDSEFSCAASVFDETMMWLVETVCVRHMNCSRTSGTSSMCPSWKNSWMNWLYLLYTSGCFCKRKMRLRSLLFAWWYESRRGLASSLKGSFTTNLSCVGWYPESL